MALGNRVRQLRTEQGLTLEQLSKGIGLNSSSTIQTLENKDAVGSKHINKIAEFLGANIVWLLTGDGEKHSHKVAEESAAHPAENTVTINQHNDVRGSMGTGLLLPYQNGKITGMSVSKEWVSKNVPANTGTDNLRIVTGFGDSMKGMFNSGDPLMVDAGVKEVKFDGVYFFRVGDEGFIKRLQRIPNNGIIVISNNPNYRDWTITEDMDFEVFGRVLKVWNGSET